MSYPSGASCGEPIMVVGSPVIIGPGVLSISGLPTGLIFPGVYGPDYISGSPTSAGFYSGTVNGLPFKWVVAVNGDIVSWDGAGVNFTVGVDGTSSPITVTGGTSGAFNLYNDIWSVCPPIGDSLPEGLTLNGDGSITGTPAAGTEGTYEIELVYVDSEFHTPSGFITVTVHGAAGGTIEVTRAIFDSFPGLLDSVVITISSLDAESRSFGDSLPGFTDGVSTHVTVIPPGDIPDIPPPQPGDNRIFEFYELQTPLDVEDLPVPKKYDQLGPVRFDKIGKLFGFRVRLIPNGSMTVVPYTIWGDQSIISTKLNYKLFSGSFEVFPGKDRVYEIKLPKSVNSTVFRITLGPCPDSFHRYNMLFKVHISGMQGQAQWLPIQ